ncbi:MAG: peptide deformylase [Epsilonproteobacteria bacterium]|nr:peptide deformylase [Campylobacterota bacterium]
MTKQITTYPQPLSVEFASDVRVFNEELFSFIDDLKDTIIENNLDGLSATQVGSYYSVVVVKKDDEEFLELINPRILTTRGKITTVEHTSYYKDKYAKVTRANTISLIYEDRDAKQHSLSVSGNFSVLLQRKIDYLFGANFLTKLSKEDRENFELGLANDSTLSCPPKIRTGFSRDYFIHASNYIMIGMLLLLGVSFFISDKVSLETIWNYQLYISFVVLGINLFYILYSYYENKRFSICTNCYNMSIFGVTVLGLFRLTLVMLASYLLIKP